MKMPKNMGGIDNLLKAVQDQLSNKEDMINKIESDMESFIDEVMDDLEEGDADIEIVKDEDRGSGESYTDWSPNPEDYLT
jgi:peptide subunit release factor 1 (eRF1)